MSPDASPDVHTGHSEGAGDALAPYLQVADALRSRIRFGDLAPGDKLPSQRELADHYKVARATVQAALRMLRAEGLTASRRGSGEFVAKHPLPPDTTSQAPKIRVHRYEDILAIKWPHFDRWLMVWPNQYARDGQPAAGTEWRSLLYGDTDLTEREGWVDPAVDHHTDLRRWTGAIRRDLSSIEQVLKSLERHPWG
jgi:DNA-binding transcriptional regulator YhcF (GntR family)